MALHRDIYWLGRQWAVTGHGIQACDQKQKGKFDIEASRIWEEGVLDSMRAQKWLNIEDFNKAVSAARKHYPEPPRKAASHEEEALSLKARSTIEPPKPAVQKFEMRIEDWPAKFLAIWRVRSWR